MSTITTTSPSIAIIGASSVGLTLAKVLHHRGLLGELHHLRA